MKALKIIGIIILVIIAIILVGAFFMPAKIGLEKTVVINAATETVFEQVNCFRNWEKWSPWKDTTMVYSYEGSACGMGSIQKWTITGKEEHGTQTITQSEPGKFIRTEIDFGPQEMVYSNWLFDETGDDGVKVTWTFESDAPYPLGRWFGQFLVKPMVARDYEKGLNNLKEMAENMPPPLLYQTGPVTEKMVLGSPALTILDSCNMADIGTKMGKMFGELQAYVEKNRIETTGPPFCAYPDWDPSKKIVMLAGIPIKKPVKAMGTIKMSKTYQGKTLMAVHYGAYEATPKTYEKIQGYMKEKGYQPNGTPWEIYITDPMNEPDVSKWVTEVYYPVK
ncbi:MAG: SRPBCC family protein [Bacteroidales bacterium]|nr:SRPBCC family protein [Bacteroidales bacterium]